MDNLDKLQFLNGYLVAAMHELHIAKGDVKSGLFQFYIDRYKNQRRALPDYEMLVADYVVATFPAGMRVAEAGAGIGTLSVALAMLGCNVAAIESNKDRAEAARALAARMGAVAGPGAGRLDVVEGIFPDVLFNGSMTSKAQVLVFTNFISDMPDPVQWHIAANFFRFERVILDLRLFGRYRDSENERQELVEQITRRTRPRAVAAVPRGRFDLGGETHYIDLHYSLPAAKR